MPWLEEAMKDVISCEKSGVGANNLRYPNVRMGQPGTVKPYHSVNTEGKRGELKHLSTLRRRKQK